MTFIDDLALVLDLLILVAVAVFYTGFMVWLEMHRKDPLRAQSHLRMGAILLGGLGAVLGLIALWGEFTWPLNVTVPVNGTPTNVLAAYDLLFFDALLMLAFLLIAFAIAVLYRLPTHMVGVLGVVIGGGIIYYGYRAWTLSLTEEPFDTLLLFLGFGAVAIGSYPISLYLDWFVVGPTTPGADPMPSDARPRYPILWNVLIGIFLVLVILAGVAALYYGYDTAWAHLGAPP
jgi:putative membrane protein